MLIYYTNPNAIYIDEFQQHAHKTTNGFTNPSPDLNNSKTERNLPKEDYIPASPHRAKLIQIPDNGIELPFNIITSSSTSNTDTHNSYSKASANGHGKLPVKIVSINQIQNQSGRFDENPDDSSNSILSTSQYKFPRKNSYSNGTTTSSPSINIPIQNNRYNSDNNANHAASSSPNSNSQFPKQSSLLNSSSGSKLFTIPGIVNNNNNNNASNINFSSSNQQNHARPSSLSNNEPKSPSLFVFFNKKYIESHIFV